MMADEKLTTNTSHVSAWERASFTLTYAVVSALLMLLGLRGLYRLGRVFGTVEWLINHKRRRRFAGALRSISEGGTIPANWRSATREHFIRSRCDKLFYLVFDRIPRERALSLFTMTNQHWIDEALSQGRGVYIALSHHGAHHVAAMLMALRGYQVAGVRDRNEGGLRRFVQDRFDRRYPEFQRLRVLYADSYPRDVYRCLQNGYVLGSAMDISRKRSDHQGIAEVRLFGETREFLTGPLRVAARCRALVVQGFILSEPGFRYHLDIVERLIEPEHEQDETDLLHTALQTYAGNIETRIRSTPALLSRV